MNHTDFILDIIDCIPSIKNSSIAACQLGLS